MGRIVKLLGIVIGSVIALFCVALLAVAWLFDPNDYKDQIVAAVGDATGRELTLEGDLELDLFPRIGIALGPAAISNAPGFGNEPFARIETARLQLELLPLLARRVEVGRAELRGLSLNLARNASGINNWQDLAGAAGAEEAAAESAPADAAQTIALDVGAIEIADAAVNWTDAVAGTRWQLERFNLSASNFGPGVTFPLALDFALAGDEVAVEVDARMQAALDVAANRYRLRDLEVDIAGEGNAWPGGTGDVRLRSAVLDADLNGETVAIEQLVVEALGLSISGNVTGSNIVSDPALRGVIEIGQFDPRDLLDTFDVALETADPAVLRRATVRGALVHDARQSMLTDLELTLDDSRMTGRAGLLGEALSFDIAIDAIDVDRYLPPAAEGEAGAEAEAGSLDEVDLPLDALRTLRASGQLALAQAKFMGLNLTDARFALTAASGTVVLTPQAALYGGTYGGGIGIVVGQDSARIDLEQTLDGVDMLALGRDFLGSEMVSGTGRVRLDLVGNGANLGDVRRGLDGDVSFGLTDGAWQGMDLWYELRRARAVLDGNAPPARQGPRETAFSEVSATGVIEDAVLINRDLKAVLPFMQVSGSGSANLLTDALDFDLTAQFVDGPAMQADPAMANLAGATLPFTVGGTLSEPTVRPDFGAVVRARIQSEIDERQEEVERQVEEQVEQETDELRQRLEDRFRGLLNR